ncbi:DNA-binding response regulator [Aquabacterium olei]|jgi:two-component system response regulator TctD|uniref:DNA-binding response regulator n=1 Tax=Aquabacterium olei TaxID=1296669 RepID=A0A2U8FMF4_9BURK|nr:response regulator [Aquabacterium olei]AWI52189.1 DNA-binding response regulator [Aquabacterium olei]
MRVLLAEDEHALGEWLSKALARSGTQVDWVDDGQLAERALDDTDYDALILDLGLPGLTGRQLLQRLRARDRRLPVLILTARDSLAERVQALNQGADDFLAKPFALEELEARLMALVRRARGADNPRLACGPLQYDTVSRQFSLSEAPLHLSPREHAVLRALIQRTGEPMSKAQIIARVFSDEDDVLPDVIEVLVHRLRKRLEGTGLAIVTYRGLGYALEMAA